MADIMCRNSLLFDGSGAPPIIADVAVTNGKITAIGSHLEAACNTVEIEC